MYDEPYIECSSILTQRIEFYRYLYRLKIDNIRKNLETKQNILKMFKSTCVMHQVQIMIK